MKILSIVAVVLASMTIIFPGFEVNAQEKDWSISVDAPVNSKYIWRGINLVDDFVFQPSVALSTGGFSASVWGSMELTDINEYGADFGDAAMEFTELDFTLEYAFSIESVDIGVGYINYRFPNTPFDPITELYITAALNIFLSPSISIFQDIDAAEGTYFNLAVGHSIVFDAADFAVDFNAWAAVASANHNAFYYVVNESGLADAGLSASAPYNVNDSLVITPTITVTTLLGGDARDLSNNPDNLYLGIGLSYTF